uniref:ADP-ribosylation factor-like protein 6-interacting protein 4 n=1 Tax=Molossus molossus TaxID=27622 RepID=A0A7J8BX55_MOLMO|nr:ADP ribosylation factor like GTPase 6 interacting protein 4 [Molossus molossus]
MAQVRAAGCAGPGGSPLQSDHHLLPCPLLVLTDEQKSRIQAMKPMTKEEWDARQSVIRKVVDPETGRTRLIKGDGEVLEEIVTKERHREINKQATRGDGLAFQMRAGLLP